MAFLLLPGIFGLILSACTVVEKEPQAKGPVRELPLAEYKDTTLLDMYEGSRLSWVLRTLYLVKWPRTDLVKAKPVHLVMYDSLQKLAVTVTSDSGSVDEAISFLLASGHVHAHSVKGVDITADSLRWNKTINRISTESRVRVISEDGDTLTGRGFVSDANLDNWQILGEVKGIFQKVEERFHRADTSATAPPAGVPAVDSSAPALPVPPPPALVKPAVPADSAGATTAPSGGQP